MALEPFARRASDLDDVHHKTARAPTPFAAPSPRPPDHVRYREQWFLRGLRMVVLEPRRTPSLPREPIQLPTVAILDRLVGLKAQDRVAPTSEASDELPETCFASVQLPLVSRAGQEDRRGEPGRDRDVGGRLAVRAVDEPLAREGLRDEQGDATERWAAAPAVRQVGSS